MVVLYADELFLENLVIDYILLIVTARLTGVPAKRWRALLAAVLGGTYGLLAAVSGAQVLTGVVFKLAVGVLMVLIVFGGAERFLRVCLVFFGVSAAFAGAVMASTMFRGGPPGALFGGVSLGVLAGAFALSFAMFTLAFRSITRHRVAGEIVPMTIAQGDREVRITALVDTGNGLMDPIHGQPVTVCALEALRPLFDPGTLRILREHPDAATALERLTNRPGVPAFFLIPFRAVGTRGGVLLAFRPGSIRCRGRLITGGVVAIASEGLTGGGGYAAITGKI